MATCSECTYLNLNKERDKDGQFWCEEKLEWFYADSAECKSYCKADNRSSSVAESHRKYSKEKQSSGGCFITTMLCEILGLKDDNIYLQILREFRNNYLQKNPNTINILKEYDFVGPLIAQKLKNDPNNKIVAREYFCNYIIEITEDIYNSRFNNAINRYIDMTNELMEMYKLGVFKLTIAKPNEFSYEEDYSSYGHGKKIKMV